MTVVEVKSEMGIFWRRTPEAVTQSATSLIYLQTSQNFCNEFTRQLNEENLRDIAVIFRMVDLSVLSLSKTLFHNNETFRKTFKHELQTYEHNLKRPKLHNDAIALRTKLHCFAVLTVYVDMVQYFDDPARLDNILQQIATSHSFISDPRTSLEIYGTLLKQFMNQEFGKYMSVDTRKAFKRYMKLINTRLRILVEQYSNCENGIEAMEFQRKVLRARLDEVNQFTPLYINESVNRPSQYSPITGQGTFPGTSRAQDPKHTLDKSNKQL